MSGMTPSVVYTTTFKMLIPNFITFKPARRDTQKVWNLHKLQPMDCGINASLCQPTDMITL